MDNSQPKKKKEPLTTILPKVMAKNVTTSASLKKLPTPTAASIKKSNDILVAATKDTLPHGIQTFNALLLVHDAESTYALASAMLQSNSTTLILATSSTKDGDDDDTTSNPNALDHGTKPNNNNSTNTDKTQYYHEPLGAGGAVGVPTNKPGQSNAQTNTSVIHNTVADADTPDWHAMIARIGEACSNYTTTCRGAAAKDTTTVTAVTTATTVTTTTTTVTTSLEDLGHLALWVSRQRTFRYMLTHRQRTALEGMATKTTAAARQVVVSNSSSPTSSGFCTIFDWGKQKQGANHLRWELMWAKLVEFKRVFKHVKVPIRWKQDATLGKWVSRQRDTAAQLSHERAFKLNQLGFVWQCGNNTIHNRREVEGRARAAAAAAVVGTRTTHQEVLQQQHLPVHQLVAAAVVATTPPPRTTTTTNNATSRAKTTPANANADADADGGNGPHQKQRSVVYSALMEQERTRLHTIQSKNTKHRTKRIRQQQQIILDNKRGVAAAAAPTSTSTATTAPASSYLTPPPKKKKTTRAYPKVRASVIGTTSKHNTYRSSDLNTKNGKDAEEQQAARLMASAGGGAATVPGGTAGNDDHDGASSNGESDDGYHYSDNFFHLRYQKKSLRKGSTARAANSKLALKTVATITPAMTIGTATVNTTDANYLRSPIRRYGGSTADDPFSPTIRKIAPTSLLLLSAATGTISSSISNSRASSPATAAAMVAADSPTDGSRFSGTKRSLEGDYFQDALEHHPPPSPPTEDERKEEDSSSSPTRTVQVSAAVTPLSVDASSSPTMSDGSLELELVELSAAPKEASPPTSTLVGIQMHPGSSVFTPIRAAAGNSSKRQRQQLVAKNRGGAIGQEAELRSFALQCCQQMNRSEEDWNRKQTWRTICK